MTKERFPSPNLWLDIPLCESIYNIYRNHTLKDTDLAPMPGFETRFEGALEGILGSVNIKASIKNYDIVQVAVCLFCRFVKSQAFLDGNKRMSILFTNLYLITHEYKLNIKREVLENIALFLSSEKNISVQDAEKALTPLFKKNVIKIRKL